ncbi:hypothetical protein PY310_19605 [Pseudarthrobacter sp. H3Y2-7]|uniref:hypothetical protein n=1 Tax=Pseudarthrobacter naphthalenicus TaxID=3031328 RepID=UPI0023AF6C84|nr:hypothetical protein [Pseudarthrobacter sp. H3Y2-7]MDE8670782.1 hypothetical protein [Pseudarthrobacter sp. H3Y2-7]
MSPDGYPNPVAISRLTPGEMSREPQNVRAINWLLAQPGGPVVVVTPRKDFDGTSLMKLVAQPRVTHRTWRGFSRGVLSGTRVIHAWPDRQHLDDLWGCAADAIVVIEWNERHTAEWIADAKPVQLFLDQTVDPNLEAVDEEAQEPLPNGVEGILEHIAHMAAGYSSGLKWNEEDKLKADMMNRPERWGPITVDQVRVKCRELRMRPRDVDTIAGFLQRRKEGRRFNVRSSYRGFQFN